MSIESVMPSNHLILCRPLQSFPASQSFQMSQFFASGGQSTGVSASASVLPMNIQGRFPLGWTGWISLLSQGLSRVISNTTVQIYLQGKCQSFPTERVVSCGSRLCPFIRLGKFPSVPTLLSLVCFFNREGVLVLSSFCSSPQKTCLLLKCPKLAHFGGQKLKCKSAGKKTTPAT